MIPPKLLSVKNFSLTAYLGQLLEKGRTHKLKKFLCATIFGGFWIEWKQKQKGVVFFTKSCGPALDPPPLSCCGAHQPKLQLFYFVTPLTAARSALVDPFDPISKTLNILA